MVLPFCSAGSPRILLQVAASGIQDPLCPTLASVNKKPAFPEPGQSLFDRASWRRRSILYERAHQAPAAEMPQARVSEQPFPTKDPVSDFSVTQSLTTHLEGLLPSALKIAAFL